ncbi:sugar kinase [Actinomadura macrotermitis]|uniref:2-dehydro-3-deoxygluconokinase n=1 Tax=Actinomadura macrotermitis TaxID=2585200 RepID=A0A7K0BWV5_9ACTN|nr:sugar kinase [Actinomadura macrotermitis]MQY05660.1 2-dehydro-3-deoxygluconokinase [Actinomadura macrotermitis]
MPRPPAVVCLGEAMAALLPGTPGPLEDVAVFRPGTGGAEANVACGLAALGVPAAWIGRVGDDGFGRRIVRDLAAAGVDVTGVVVDAERPTGLFVKETRDGRSVLHYYRRGSAGSALSPGLLADPRAAALLDGAALVHLSGITPALSDGAHDLVRALLERHRVVFDLNWRPGLWRGRDPAVLRDLMNAADTVLLGADEAAAVLGTGDPAALRALLPGPRTLVVKDDAHRATALTRDGAHAEPALRVEVVEATGAGDAFAAGYLTGVLRGLDQRGRLRLGHLSAAATLVVPGDHGDPGVLPGPVDDLLAATPAEWADIVVRRAAP